MTTKQTISDIILNNKWNSHTWLMTPEANRLISSGIVSNNEPDAQTVINAVNFENVQATVSSGFSTYDFSEQNLGSEDVNSSATPQDPYFKTASAKTFYANQWWRAVNINQDLMNVSKPKELVARKIAEFWTTQLNRLIASTLAGMKDITDITFGATNKNFSETQVLDIMKSRGDNGYGKMSRIFMSSVTLDDILRKQKKAKTDSDYIETVITRDYGPTTIVTENSGAGSVQTQVRGTTPTWVFGGVVPITLDDAIGSGLIAFVENAAFAIPFKRFDNSLLYSNDPTKGDGAGVEMWGTKAIYMCHPLGFSFKGTKAAAATAGNFAKNTGLTEAELKRGGLYEITDNKKFSKIALVKVKVG